MATRVHPQAVLPPFPSSPSAAPPSTSDSGREAFTIWMKSLVLHGNGCTVYDAGGEIVYRVDNYARRRGNSSVYLMDAAGKDLLKIATKRLSAFRCWEGYRLGEYSRLLEPKPWFTVKKPWTTVLRGGSFCEVAVALGQDGVGRSACFTVDEVANKSSYRITDVAGDVVAECKRKATETGISYGDDILTLVVEPNVDRVLIMGVVIVCGLINRLL